LILIPESAQVFELPHSKLSAIISDDVVGHTKHVHDLIDEFHFLGYYDGGSRLNFDPFCELVNCNEDMCESTFSFLERTYQIQSLGRERPGHGYGL
jgi:hypothetical protein